MGDDDRARVNTYVPQYQKEAWVEHAEELDMSQSEFVRTMVQAGRRGFDAEVSVDRAGTSGNGGEPANEQATNSANNSNRGGSASGEFEARVRDVLAGDQHLSWDELVGALTEDLEDRLETTLQELQAAGEVRHSGRHGGYTLVDE